VAAYRNVVYIRGKDKPSVTVQAYIDVYEAENTLEVLKKSKEALSRNYEEQKEKYKLRLVQSLNL